ncbi:MAG TPA: hypothetical protein VHM24_01430, partial [Gemmatimonadaceae bacterium]|nr:hypothetical protein [Gemmatimonadaceae bacterium]
AAFAEQLLWAWTGNPELARNGAPVLRLYALGNGIGAIAVFPYYLQYAKGNMRLHVIGNIVFLVLLAPSLVWATINYGAVGAGWAWLFSNMTYLLGWTPLVHRRFEPGLHHRWLGEDVAALSLVSGITAWGLSLVYHPSGSRVGVIAILLLIGLMTVAITAAASTTCRAYLGVLLRRRSLTASPEGIQ